jgi:glycosyltransferase involved in cell wall biosynthesis
MKYPFIIFYRLDKYSNIDNFFIENNESLNCTLFFTSNKEDLNNMFDFNYHLLITYGPDESEYIDNCLSVISDRMRNRWIHLNEIYSIYTFNNSVNFCFIHNCSLSREQSRPVFSVFTTSYNSYNKIIRAYDSLKEQTLKDWEWIILDDSPDDDHFNYLRKLMINDKRIRLYRKAENSGSIGNVKNEAVSLCRGKYVVEFDHDDILLPFVLKDSATYFDANEHVGFIYMDTVNLYENGSNYSYGDFISLGYGSYYTQKYNNQWVNVYNAPNINNITLTHLVACPNHPRIWRKDILIKAGNYSEFLPICDDYEIILRTALITKMAKIHKFGYIQFMNENNNNFSLIRNAEINRIGPQYISPMYYNFFNIDEHMKELDACEDDCYKNVYSKVWEREHTYEHKFCNEVVNLDFDKQFCIIGIDSLIKNLDKINELYQNPRNDFIVIDNKCTIDYLQNKLDRYGFSRFKCYTLVDTPDDNLIQYFKFLYKSCKDYEIINDNTSKLAYNTDYYERFVAINNNTKNTDVYLEIGVENGFTFSNVHFLNKTGVDPDPKCDYNNIIKKTSDEYFSQLEDNVNLDVVFIDGMHQSEFVCNDINNVLKVLNENGKILLDDILPLTYDEQLKIPNAHYYENGILKYGEPWTGDVWRVVYHLLKNYSECFTFSYFHHINYRGVAMLEIKYKFNISNDELAFINEYDYFKDYNDYIDLIKNINL